MIYLNYNLTSEFIPFIKQHLKSEQYQIDFNDYPKKEKGYEGEFLIKISIDNKLKFLANTTEKNLSSFPARIRAAVTTLYRLEKFGEYFISYYNKQLDVKFIK